MNEKQSLTLYRLLTVLATVLATFSIASCFEIRTQRNRIERLETDQQETLQIIKLHLEKQHGIFKAVTNTLTISNASEKTIQFVSPIPFTEVKEDK